MGMALHHDGVEFLPGQQAHPWQGRVEIQVGQAFGLCLARAAVEDGDVEQIGHQRGKFVAPFGSRSQPIPQQGPAAGCLRALNVAWLA